MKSQEDRGISSFWGGNEGENGVGVRSVNVPHGPGHLQGRLMSI